MAASPTFHWSECRAVGSSHSRDRGEITLATNVKRRTDMTSRLRTERDTAPGRRTRFPVGERVPQWHRSLLLSLTVGVAPFGKRLPLAGPKPCATARREAHKRDGTSHPASVGSGTSASR